MWMLISCDYVILSWYKWVCVSCVSQRLSYKVFDIFQDLVVVLEAVRIVAVALSPVTPKLSLSVYLQLGYSEEDFRTLTWVGTLFCDQRNFLFFYLHVFEFHSSRESIFTKWIKTHGSHHLWDKCKISSLRHTYVSIFQTSLWFHLWRIAHPSVDVDIGHYCLIKQTGRWLAMGEQRKIY